ncbi:lactate utilization protein C [Spongiactinospora gelatinilytica]|uniref:Lactate utilization protein C n=1 Tax=Spongiactinospora gelatinilytica TaxID=2666298 RepID=A0A2W2FYW9_9ACTN|nr:LUD domain-containing protein [Spongiactinospora gelatinilytica]PZG40931.1 lactate utilization protein C [Spongiactinospora gelatinilytica]
MSGSRERILARVRAAVRDAPEAEIPRAHHPAGSREGIAAERFAERVGDYRASVHIAPEADAPALIAEALDRRGVRRIVVPGGLHAEWAAAVPPAAVLRDEPPLAASALDAADGVITGCAVAVAETGTIVLDAGPGQGRRALTLIPDYHLCLVRAAQIVPGVPEAIAALDPARPLTWISGPSATSDIELDRVEGVHGPRTLEVVIVTQ